MAGPVGGSPEKTLAVITAGYDVLLVPEAKATATEPVASRRVTVLGVATLDDAIEGLRTS